MCVLTQIQWEATSEVLFLCHFVLYFTVYNAKKAVSKNVPSHFPQGYRHFGVTPKLLFCLGPISSRKRGPVYQEVLGTSMFANSPWFSRHFWGPLSKLSCDGSHAVPFSLVFQKKKKVEKKKKKKLGEKRNFALTRRRI